MQEKAKVTAIDNDIVTVVPLDIEMCIGCSNSECKNNGSVFSAANNRKLNIVVGSEVRISAPVKNQLFQALSSVGIPILIAFLTWQLIALFFPGANEMILVIGALIALFAGAVLMFVVSRIKAKDLPEITEVL